MLNGNSGWEDVSKIFDTTDFGYREIRVERPLRLRFEVTEPALAALRAAKPVEKLDEESQEALCESLRAHLKGQTWVDRKKFLKALTGALRASGIKIGAPVQKAIIIALGERDEEAEICRDKNGNPEPDTSLRDHELVPLGEDWRAYVAREVTPFVPDAWVDESHTDATDGKVGRVGYEINFNRYFYTYVPPRPLEEIDAELKALEAEIAGLLKEVVE
jgi:type I restriction enzyme M protein